MHQLHGYCWHIVAGILVDAYGVGHEMLAEVAVVCAVIVAGVMCAIDVIVEVVVVVIVVVAAAAAVALMKLKLDEALLLTLHTTACKVGQETA